MEIISVKRPFQADNKECEQKRKILRSYVWDEELTYSEQKKLLMDADTRGKLAEYCPENIIVIKTRKTDILVIRLYNPEKNVIEYYCDGDKECPSSIINLFEENSVSADSINEVEITEEDTGQIYGYLSPKRGIIVFKTSIPPGVSGKKKLGVGQECANVSNISDHKKKLFALGEQFYENTESTHGLTASL